VKLRIVSFLLVIGMAFTGLYFVFADGYDDLTDEEKYNESIKEQNGSNSSPNMIYGEKGETVYIYVAPNGSSTASGAIANPYGSIEDAIRKVTKIRETAGSPSEIQVIFRGGDYRISNSISLDGTNTGFNNDCRVVFKAYEGEKPIFKGSNQIDLAKMEQLTDKKILDRMDASVREKIGVIDLNQQGIKDMSKDPDGLVTYYKVYLDEKEQMISQWPNGEFNYGEFRSVEKGGAGKDGVGGAFMYLNTTRPERWLDANDAVIGGFLGIDFSMDLAAMAGVEPKSSIIRLKHGTNYQVSSTGSRRWKAYNLLEEIDMPGEWYIDRDKQLMYYYYPYGLSNAKMELSTLSAPMFTFSNAANITFEGIKFAQTCGAVFLGNTDGSSVTNFMVNGCEFTDIQGKCFDFQTYNMGKFFDHANYQNRIGNCYNVKITNNIFFNNGNHAISINSGNPNTLESAGLIIQNNYANQSASYANESFNLLASFNAIGAVVNNNLVHNGFFHAINMAGSLNDVSYNELSYLTRETSDCGAIYSGRTVVQRGNQISYNFFNIPISSQIKDARSNAIYFDDGFCGVNIHHNIGVKGNNFISASGSSNEIESNTMVNFKEGISFSPRGLPLHRKLLKKETLADPDFTNIILNRFPEIMDEYNLLEKISYSYLVFNKCIGNYGVNSKKIGSGLRKLMYENNTFENNIDEETSTAFVNPQELDYRVRKDSEVYKKNPDLVSEDFDLSKIGIQWKDFGGKERITDKRSFRKLFPENGRTNVKSYQLDFMWEKAFDADKYRFVLATDPDFENIVEDKECGHNYTTIEHLDASYTDYYWTVYAINDTMSLKGEWKANGVTYRFTTAKAEFLDITSLENAIEKVNEMLPLIKEGTTGGKYLEGTLQRIDDALKEAKEALKWKEGEKLQSDVERIIDKLNDSISDNYMNEGYYDLSDALKDQKAWTIRDESSSNIKFDNGKVKMSCYDDSGQKLIGAVYMENQNLAPFSKKILYKFKMKVDFGVSDNMNQFIALSVRGQEIGADVWACENYYFCIKHDKIEVQLKTGGSSRIIYTKENHILEDKEWHDVVFGAIDCQFGQLMVLFIDGEQVAEFMHTDSDQITRYGGLKINSWAPIELEFAGGEDVQDPAPFDEMIRNNSLTGLADLCASINKAQTSDDGILLYIGSKHYYANSKLHKMDKPVITLLEGQAVINLDNVKTVLGIDSKVEGNKVEFSRVDNLASFNIVDTVDTQYSDVIYRQNDGIYVPLRPLLNSMSISLAYYEGLISGNTKGYMEFANMLDKANSTQMAFDIITGREE